MLKIAICDDESFMLDELSSMLVNYANGNNLSFQITRYSSGRELLESDEQFDVLFLDIQMKPPDGMETAHQLRSQGFSGPLIFTTVLRETVFDVFPLQAFDYLIKPIEEYRFTRTMDRIMQSVENQGRKTLIVQKQNTCQIIPFSQILYCEVIGRKIYLHQQNAEIIDYYEKMEKLVIQLDKRFFRCHRSYLVNLDYVLGCKDGLVTLSDGNRIPVSRLREQALVEALLMHMREGYHGFV